MKKNFIIALAFFNLTLGFCFIKGMEKRRSLSWDGGIEKQSTKELLFSESFLDNLIDQINNNNFQTLEVILPQLFNYIYIKYSGIDRLSLFKRIKDHNPELFFKEIIAEINKDNFVNFDVIQEKFLTPLSDYIYKTYQDEEILPLMEKIETHRKETKS